MQVHSVSAQVQSSPCETITCLPRPGLRPYIAGYGGFHASPLGMVRRRVLPVNLTTLIIDFTGSECLVTGPRSTSVIHERPTWRHGVAVGLTPEGVLALLGMPMGELAGMITCLEAFLGIRVARLAERLGESPDWASRFAILDDWCAAELRPRVGSNGLALPAGRRLVESAGKITIAGLAGEFGVSRRHLETGFRRQIGMAPKTVARIARFQHAVRVLGEPTARLGQAVECGYADQSHLSREIRALTGVTPTELFAFLQDSHRRAG